MKKIYALLLIASVCFAQKIIAQTGPCNIIVDFLADTDLVNPSLIHFTNLSTGIEPSDSTIWYFGDGSVSYERNPSHIYWEGGTYTVCLTIQKNQSNSYEPLCSSRYCRLVTVRYVCNTVPDFRFERDSSAGLTSINFFNTYAPYNSNDSSFWGFGDGSAAAVNASTNIVNHEYAATGSYQVCLTVKKIIPGSGGQVCERQICKTVVVEAPVPCNLQANFDYYIDSVNPRQVHFINLSSPFNGPDSLWDFGDGYHADTALNPVHTYNDGGTFSVCLKIRNNTPAGTQPCVAEYCKLITLPYNQSNCNIVPEFYFTQDSVTDVHSFLFYNYTNRNSTDSSFWDFGDGSARVRDTGLIRHVYAETGMYTVCLTVKKMIPGTGTVVCEKGICKVLVVPVFPPCSILPDFSAQSYGNDKYAVFVNNSTGNLLGATYNWNFGDSSTGSGNYTGHLYAQAGSYNACLTVTTGANCSATKCDSVKIIEPLVQNCDSSRAAFSSNRDYYLPNKFYFFNTTASPLLWQQWSFKNLSGNDSAMVSYENNPVHIFSDTGNYAVCLKAYFQNSCINESCKTVRINSVEIPSDCYLLAFPNPVTSSVSVNVQLEQSAPITAVVYSFQGIAISQLIKPGIAGNNVITLNTATLPTGFYSIKITYGSKTCFSRFQKI